MRSILEELKEVYDELTAGRTLAGSEQLYRLARTSHEIAHGTTGPKRILAFVLFAVFQSLAEKQDGQPVSVEEARRLHDVLHEPIIEAIDHLDADEPESVLVPLLLRLLDGFIPPPASHS